MNTHLARIGRIDETTGFWLVTADQAHALPLGAAVVVHPFSTGEPLQATGAYVRDYSGWYGYNGHRYSLDHLIYRVLWPIPAVMS